MSENQIVARTPLEAQLRDPGRQMEIMRAMPFDSPKTKHALMQQFVDLARNPPKSIANASPASLFECVLGAARLGLQLNGPLHQASAVCYGNTAQLIVEYRGLVKLMRAGGVKEIHTGLVHENDKYEWTERDFRLSRTLSDDRGEAVGAYCKLVMQDGSNQCEVMTKAEIEHVRQKSKAKNSGPWVTDWGQMARKTVLRRAANLVELREREAGLLAQADKTEFQFEDAEVEIRGAPKAAPKGSQAVLEAAKAPEPPPVPPAAPEPPKPKQQAPAEIDPETGEVIPSDLPMPGSPPSLGKPKAADTVHLARSQRLAKRLGLPVWQKLTESRRRLLKERMAEEGLKDTQAFWNRAEAVLGRVTPAYYEGWSEAASLDVLIRVPKRGNPDHWTKLAEGQVLKPHEQQEKASAIDELMGW